jgi:hypothetical protein
MISSYKYLSIVMQHTFPCGCIHNSMLTIWAMNGWYYITSECLIHTRGDFMRDCGCVKTHISKWKNHKLCYMHRLEDIRRE